MKAFWGTPGRMGSSVADISEEVVLLVSAVKKVETVVGNQCIPHLIFAVWKGFAFNVAIAVFPHLRDDVG